MAVKHVFTSTIADGADGTLVRPSNWNADHTIDGASITPSTDATTALGSSSFRFTDLYLSGGVFVGGATTANYLTDYEEGTFSPTITTDAVDFTSVSYIVRQGTYVKTGANVAIYVNLMTSVVNVGSGSGNAAIGGLPFSVSTGTNGACPFVGTANWATQSPFAGRPDEGTSRMSLWYPTFLTAGLNTQLTSTNVNTGNFANQGTFTAVYRTG